MGDIRWKDLLKYFLHGLLFSGIFLVLGTIWFIFAAALVYWGLFIGLIIGLLVLFLIIGRINAFLMGILWSVPIELYWLSLLLHGLVLFIGLTIASIPSFIIDMIVPSLVTTIVLFIINCFINGAIAKAVAMQWEGESPEATERTHPPNYDETDPFASNCSHRFKSLTRRICLTLRTIFCPTEESNLLHETYLDPNRGA